MQLDRWDDRSFHMTHQFLVGDRVVAEGTSIGAIRNRDGVVPPETVVATLRDMMASIAPWPATSSPVR